MITAKDVSFSYGGTQIINNLSFNVNEGSFVGILGSNGSGKTTFLRLLVGVLKPTGGFISIRPSVKMAYVKQTVPGENGNFPADVEEVVTLGLLRKGMLIPSKKERAAIENVLRETGLNEVRRKLVSELSGGQKQRLKLAKALVQNPSLLILDEPSSGLDHEGRERLHVIIENLHQAGKTVIEVSHNEADLRDADVIYRLLDGKLVKEEQNVPI